MMPDKKAIKNSANFALLAEQIMSGLAGSEDGAPSSKQEFSQAKSSSTSFSIKNIKVPDSLVESVLIGFGYNQPKTHPKFGSKGDYNVNFTKGTTEHIEEEKIVDEQEIETKITSLVNRLNSLLVEAKQVLSEMCGVGSGSLGVHTMKKLKKKTKEGTSWT